MMRSPVTSIIIPCYRQAHFLPQAVRSALGQSLRDVEVVVVDDGSPDDPVGRLGDLVRDPRVVIVRQENRGLPMARNAGVLASHGEFLNFLDADDWLAPEFCERLVPALESDKALGFVYCDLRRVYEEPGEASEDEREYSVGRSRQATSGNILPSLLVGGYFTPHTVLAPRRVLNDVGLFDRELGGNADWDLWLRIAAAGYPARYVGERLAYYRIHAHSMSADSVHMDATRSATLHKLLRASPDAVADSLEELRRRVEQAAELRPWVQSLEEAKAWHARHAKNWEREAERLRSEIRSLEEANAWSAEHAKNWQREAERLQTEAGRWTARLLRVPAPLRRWLERSASRVPDRP